MADIPTFSPRADPVSRWLLLVAALIYLFTAKGYQEVSDTSFSLRTAEAIVTRGRLDIPPSAGSTRSATDGKSYSKYGIGLPLAFVPAVALSHLMAAATKLPPLEIAGFLISFLNVPFTLLTLILFGQLLIQFGATPWYARLLTSGLAVGTLCWRYAVYDFSEGMQATLLLLAVYGVVGRSPGRLAAGGLGFAGLVLVKLVNAVLLPILVCYLLWRPWPPWGSRVRAAVFVSPVVLALGLVGLLNAARFGSPLETGYGAEARQFIPAQLPDTLPRLLGSADKGLLVFCPVLALGILGWPAFIHRSPREAALCGGLVLVNLLVAGAWHSWVGGWSWGPRLLVPAIPLWLLPAGFAFGGCPSDRVRPGLTGLVLVSAVVQVPGVLVKDQQIHHIRQAMLTEPERAAFPADWSAAWVLLRHKLTRPDEIYSVAEFGLPGNRRLDLTRYRTFTGINVWTEHIARNFNAPLVRWLPMAGLTAVLTLGVGVRRPVRPKGPNRVAGPGP
jgi:hypothetical protein